MKRRDLLKMIGGAIGGGVILSACGSESGGGTGLPGGPPIPNGYQFFRILDVGDSLPDAHTAVSLPGSAMINDSSEIVFHAIGTDKGEGVYELNMDYSGSVPVVAGSRKVVRVGDSLPDGKTVSGVPIGSTNKLGYYATLLETDQSMIGVYMERDKAGFEPVAGALDALPGGGGKLGANFGDLELDDTNSILLVSYYMPGNGSQPLEGIFYLCGGMLTDATRLLVSSGDLLGESSTAIGRIGLVDITREDGNFVAQVNCGIPLSPLQSRSAGGSGRRPSSALIQGNVNAPPAGGTRVLGASSSLAVTSSLSAGPLRGDVLYGPRIGGHQQVAQVMHLSDKDLVLYFEGHEVIGTGRYSPLGNKVISISSPLVNRTGLLFVVIYTDSGEELCIYNGDAITTILASGDTVGDAGGKRIVSIGFGLVRNMIDGMGRITFVGTFEDDSKSLILGIPI